MNYISFLACCLLMSFSSLYGQLTPSMILVPSGVGVMGAGYQYKIQDYRMHYLGRDLAYDSLNADLVTIGEVPMFNNVERRVSITAYYLSSTEVTNRQYREFLAQSYLNEEEYKQLQKMLKNPSKYPDQILPAWEPVFEKAKADGVLPDSDCWMNDFKYAYNKPLTDNYFWHPAFDEYPVVGVTWKQAYAYCKWLTESNNARLAEKGLSPEPDYRLPTESEWEYAALGILPGEEGDAYHKRLFPWQGDDILDQKGEYRANIKVQPGDYSKDEHEYTASVGSFAPNEYGLYDMAGNAAEWVEDSFVLHTRLGGTNELISFEGVEVPEGQRVVKGGSWADFRQAAYCGSRTGLDPEKGYSRVGFRVARSVPSEENEEYKITPREGESGDAR